MQRRLTPAARLVRAARALSLDVLLGVACGGLLAEHATGTHMPAPWWLALLATVWAVYAADHLLDARACRGALLTHRHRLYRRHARVLRWILAADVTLAGAAAAHLPWAVVIFGAGLLAACVAYLASSQGLVAAWLPREPVAGLAYAAGIWGAPLLLATGDLRWAWFAAGLHALAAVLNLIAFGAFETRLDQRHGSRSLALALGDAPSRRVVLAAAFCGLVFASAAGSLGPPRLRLVFTVLALVVVVPSVMLQRHSWFGHRERYRIWGDLAFLATALPWLLARMGS